MSKLFVFNWSPRQNSQMPDDHPICKGHDFNRNIKISSSFKDDTLDSIMRSMLHTGFQATNVGKAINEIHRMRQWRLSDTPWKEGDDETLRDPNIRSKIRARIFFAFSAA
jgi:deoxyhypusine synthase